ncbi:MAG: YceI family protein [Acidobacteriota bacterium]
MNRFFTLFALLALSLVLAVGCAPNPADDVPAAETNDAAELPTDSSDAVEDTAAAPGDGYAISADNSEISWVGSKVTGTHDGGFEAFEGVVKVGGPNAEDVSVDVTIDANSLWSDNDSLTGHLKSADFFDVETYPTASFVTTAIAANDAGSHDVTGNLTLHGVTKEITFPATIELSETGVSADAEFSIMRFDFGIEYAGKADDLIRDEVVIRFDINAGGAGATPPADASDAGEETAEEPVA